MWNENYDQFHRFFLPYSKNKQTNADFALTNFQVTFYFHTPVKHQKVEGFLMFSGGIKVEHTLKMG